MGEILPDVTIQGYSKSCHKCNKTIPVNMQGDTIEDHKCNTMKRQFKTLNWHQLTPQQQKDISKRMKHAGVKDHEDKRGFQYTVWSDDESVRSFIEY